MSDEPVASTSATGASTGDATPKGKDAGTNPAAGPKGEGGADKGGGGAQGGGAQGRSGPPQGGKRRRGKGGGQRGPESHAPRSGGSPRLVPVPPGDVLQQIIHKGDAPTTLEWAERIGKALRGKVHLSNVRPVYGRLKRLQMQEFGDATVREVALARPHLALTAKRQSSATGLLQVLDPAFKLVSGKAHLDHLISFFEAILAYHRE